MGSYLKHVGWDFVLCALVSVSLGYTLLNGFYIDAALQYGVLPGLIVLACLLFLFLIAGSKRASLIGGIAYALVLVAVWVASAVMTPEGAIFVDSETNYFLFSFLLTATATACFLLSRTRVGAALLFILGAFLVGLIQLFYERFELAWTIVFVLATLTMIIYRNYQQSLYHATSMTKVSFAPGFAAALCSCVLAVGLGLGVWYGIIAQLDPGALDIKLVTEYRALETKQVRGTAEDYQAPQTDLTSDVTNDGQRTTDDIKEDVDGMPWPATGEEETEPEQGDVDNSFLGLNTESLIDAFDLQSNPQNWPIFVVLFLVIALIALYFVMRRVMRSRRLEKMRGLGADKEFEQVFLFLLERFRRLGVSVPKGQTMLAFGESAAPAMRYIHAETGVDFSDLTAAYSGMAYGKRSVEQKDVAKAESYYQAFWKAARKQLGSVKYFFKSFRL